MKHLKQLDAQLVGSLPSNFLVSQHARQDWWDLAWQHCLQKQSSVNSTERSHVPRISSGLYEAPGARYGMSRSLSQQLDCCRRTERSFPALIFSIVASSLTRTSEIVGSAETTPTITTTVNKMETEPISTSLQQECITLSPLQKKTNRYLSLPKMPLHEVTQARCWRPVLGKGESCGEAAERQKLKYGAAVTLRTPIHALFAPRFANALVDKT